MHERQRKKPLNPDAMWKAPKNIFEFRLKYQKALEALAKGTQGPREPDFFNIFGPFQDLARTIPSVSVDDSLLDRPLQFGEWNPLSQRPALLKFPEPKTVFGDTFDLIQQTFHGLIIAMHEFLHVALWEPFFTGLGPVGSKADFIRASLRAEAFCFFYSDIILTRQIRATFPDGEPVLSRRAVSQSTFHPYRAFEALKIQDEKKILDIYLDAFQGQTTALNSPDSRSPFVNGLSERIYLFYNVSLTPLERLYSLLCESGIFSDFYGRFCALPGIPRLMPVNGLKNLAESDYHSFLSDLSQKKNAGRTRQRWLESLVPRVKSRRAIQMRAYYAFQLKALIESGSSFSRRGRPCKSPQLLKALSRYTGDLEKALQALCRGETHKSVMDLVQKADRFYEVNVRRPMRADDLWAAKRDFLFPPEDVLSVSSLPRDILKLSPSQRLGLSSFFLKKVGKSVSISYDPPQKEMLRLLGHLFDRLVKISPRQKDWPNDVRDLLLSPPLVDIWSVPLDSVHPLENHFREVRFVYQ